MALADMSWQTIGLISCGETLLWVSVILMIDKGKAKQQSFYK
jgi:hypothetical protein